MLELSAGLLAASRSALRRKYIAVSRQLVAGGQSRRVCLHPPALFLRIKVARSAMPGGLRLPSCEALKRPAAVLY